MSARGLPSPRDPGPVVANRYRVRRKLGSGTLGAVYLARDELSGRDVALKLLRRGAGGVDSAGIELLKREFEAVASLSHPRIATALDFGFEEPTGIPFYTREYVDGVPLPPGPEGQSAMAPGAFLGPVLDVLEALEFLHSHDVLHLDIHAGNVIVRADAAGGAVLIDFGLARSAGSLAAATPLLGASRSTGAAASLLPPELLRGERPSAATDLHAVGRLLLYRLTGRYDGSLKLPGEIAGWSPRTTLGLERILARALHPERDERFRSAREFRDALRAVVGGRDGDRDAAAMAEPGESTVGRESELDLLSELIAATESGEARLLWIRGGAGSGKTRLLAEARWRAQVRGLRVIDLRFVAHADASPSIPRLLRRLARRAARTGLEWIQPLAAEHGGSTHDRARRAAAAYFAGGGDSGDAPRLVFLLDDIEHADRESRVLVEALAEAAARRTGASSRGLAIIVASSGSPGRVRIAPRAWGADLRLRPLGGEAAARLFERALHPIEIAPAVTARFVREADGSPMVLRRAALVLRERYASAGRVPEDATPGEELRASGRGSLAIELDDVERGVLRFLSIVARAADVAEIAAATELSCAAVERATKRLRAAELTSFSRVGRRRLHFACRPDALEALAGPVSSASARRVHRLCVDYLRSLASTGANDLRYRENLCRHLLAAGDRKAARAMSSELVAALRAEGRIDDAIRLLESLLGDERNRSWRVRFAESISELHEAQGDHVDGIAALEPVFLAERERLPRAQAVRMRRRLGVHFHRAGDPARAAELFEEVLALADPRRHVDELVFVYSELAELHTFQGDYDRAEAACRKGLELYTPGTRASMEVTLRATLGHLEMRRMRLERAREEFETALGLCRKRGPRALLALVLNNLGIVYNQLNAFDRAERCFREAARYLEAAGERSALIHISSNLAIIAAKLGRVEDARDEIGRAGRLLRDHPGERLEFFYRTARALVDHHLGRMTRAIEGFGGSIPLGRRLGDTYMARFSEVYLAECHIACGDYTSAGRPLRRLLADARRGEGPPVWIRLVASRLAALEALLNRPRGIRRARALLDGEPETGIGLLEAWIALARALFDPGDACVERLEAARLVFRRHGVDSGARLARAALAWFAIRARRSAALRSFVDEIAGDGESPHHVVASVESVLAAEACLALGELDRAEAFLMRAAGGGFPQSFLELDWRIDFLFARIADRRGDLESARHHVRRALQTRDLLVRGLNASAREAFLKQPRFLELEALRARVERRPSRESTPLRPEREYGIVAESDAMRAVLSSIEDMADVDLSALIVGATGTGKDLVARAIHLSSRRRKGPFHSLHCASLPVQLFESELFGHEAGAFSGAEESRSGLLDHLAGGTLLLDEVTMLPLDAQTKLLRVLDTGTVRPLGSVETRSVDVRFLGTSSDDPEEAIAAGKLRRDLLHRLGAVTLRIPTLEGRRDDIPALARHFVDLHSRRLERPAPALAPDAMRELERCAWPGNVRELEALIVRLVLSAPGESVGARDLRRFMRRAEGSRSAGLFPEELLAGRDLDELRRELERAYLTRVFRECGGEIAAMTTALGVKRSNLYTWFRRVGLDVRALRESLE